MKSKIIILIVCVAVITLSFSFARTTSTPKKVAQSTVISNQAAPAGGFIAEDKF